MSVDTNRTDYLLGLPYEMQVGLLKYLGIAEWHHLSSTCTTLAGVTAAEGSRLRTNVLTTDDLKLPVKVIRRYWNSQSRYSKGSVALCWYKKLASNKLNFDHP